jgi:O-antigen/teichoic acid export membrane protein
MLTKKTILGAGWTVSARLAGRAIDLVTVLVLARLLTPADFGLTAIASTLILISDTVLEIPLIAALTSLKSVSKSHLDTAFTVGALRGLVLGSILLASAWPFAHIYGDNRLPLLIAVLSLGPIARSLISPKMAHYVRELSFRQSFVAELAGKLIASLAAMAVVYIGGGYWAIAVNSALSSIAAMLISYYLAPYRPTLTLSRFSEFSSYLGWFSSAQAFKAVSWQFDRILLGYFMPKSTVGQFSTATDLSVLPVQSLIGPAMGPLMAAFARINDDRERLKNAYLKGTQLTMLLAVPASFGISLTSDLVVSVLLGSKWTDAAIYLRWLSLSVAFNAICQPMYALAFAMNRTNLMFRLSIVETCFRLVLVSTGFYFYSALGVAAADVAMAMIMFAASMICVRLMIDIDISSQAINLWKVAAAAITMAVLVFSARAGLHDRNLNAFLELALTATFGGIVYAVTLFALGIRPKDFLSGFGAR